MGQTNANSASIIPASTLKNDWSSPSVEGAGHGAGIQPQTVPFTAIGMFLGISYGGGLLIREARKASGVRHLSAFRRRASVIAARALQRS